MQASFIITSKHAMEIIDMRRQSGAEYQGLAGATRDSLQPFQGIIRYYLSRRL
jgi:hypothetical protein